MILRVKFSKKGYLKYISHLDLIRLFERTFRMINLPIDYSRGYNPRPIFSIALPLPLGVAGHGEYMEIDLVMEIDINEFIKEMNEELPEDIRILDCEYSDDTKAVGHYVHWADYDMSFEIKEDLNLEKLKVLENKFLSREEVLIDKKRVRKKKTIRWEENIMPLIDYIDIYSCSENRVGMKCRLKVGIGTLRPEDFIEAFCKESKIGLVEDSERIDRLELFGESLGEIHSIFKGEKN